MGHEHISNVGVHSQSNQPPASQLVAQARLRWYGHVLRLPDTNPTPAILSFSPILATWRRPRGAPRTRWLDVVTKDLLRLLKPRTWPMIESAGGPWSSLLAPCLGRRLDDDDDDDDIMGRGTILRLPCFNSLCMHAWLHHSWY